MTPELPLPIAACRFCGSDCHVEARPNGVHTSYQVICEDVPSDCGYKGPTRIYKQIAVLLHNEAMAASPAADEGAREFAIQAVDAEPEMPGEMPDEMWLAFKAEILNKESFSEMLRIIVRETKAGIRERIRKHSAVSPKAGRELNLKWGRHDGRGEYHVEWHAPCGCAYHPELHPHVHPCIKHSPIEDALHEMREMWLDFPGLGVASLSTLCIQEMSPEQAGFYALACEAAKSAASPPAVSVGEQEKGRE